MQRQRPTSGQDEVHLEHDAVLVGQVVVKPGRERSWKWKLGEVLKVKIGRGLENENLERYWKLKLQYSVVPIWHYQWPSWWWRWWGCAGPGGVLVLVDHLAPAQETLEGGRHNHPPTCLAVDCLFHILRIYFTHSHFLEYKCNIRIGKCQYQKISHKLRWRCQSITVVKTLNRDWGCLVH